MKRDAVLSALTAKNTSGSKVIRSKGAAGTEFPGDFRADLSLIATFGAAASSLVVGFQGSVDGTNWALLQSFDWTTAGLDVVETKTLTANCNRRLLTCITDMPWVRVNWALTADNDATMLRLDAVSGAS